MIHHNLCREKSMQHLLRFRCHYFVLLAVIGLLGSAAAAIAAETVVTRIQLDELDKLMADKDCRCMIVAMAAWCRPCRKELPVLNRLYLKYREKGLSVIGVSVDPGGPEEIQPLITKNKVVFPVYWVGEGAVRKYKIFGIPMIFLVKDGAVVEKIPGERPEALLEQKIEMLLKEN
jgi:thiol-disulfide isomerase/thioredoxin